MCEQLLAPLAEPLARVNPNAISVVGGFLGLGAAASASQGWWLMALVGWLLNRVLDGLDGIVARSHTDANRERGGYLDITIDLSVYAAMPLGIAAGIGSTQAWMAAAILIATFPVNTITWSYLSALGEKHKTELARTSGTPEAMVAQSGRTTLPIPTGLIEGAETVLFYAAMLAFPQFGVGLMFAMAALVLIGAGIRFRGGWERLR